MQALSDTSLIKCDILSLNAVDVTSLHQGEN